MVRLFFGGFKSAIKVADDDDASDIGLGLGASFFVGQPEHSEIRQDGGEGAAGGGTGNL